MDLNATTQDELSLEELRFQRRFVQQRLNELKKEREGLVAFKEKLDADLTERRATKHQAKAGASDQSRSLSS